MVVLVTPLSEVVLMSLTTLDFVSVKAITGTAAVVVESSVIVDTLVVVLPFGVEMIVDFSVERSVMTLDTGLGVTTSVKVSLIEMVCKWVTGEGVILMVPVIFEVLIEVTSAEGPWTVNVLYTT